MLTLSAAPLLCSDAHGKDIGVRGQVWPIRETDLLVHLKATAASFAQSGKLARWQDKAKNRAKTYVEAPPAVIGIVNAVTESSRLFDPTITVRKDIHDHRGNVIAKGGETINPLDYLPLSTSLLFIDGNDPEQVTWALGVREKNKIILTGGPVAALMRQHRRRLYFDQKGLISRRFAISSVPASVTQEGRSLRIREFPLNRENRR